MHGESRLDSKRRYEAGRVDIHEDLDRRSPKAGEDEGCWGGERKKDGGLEGDRRRAFIGQFVVIALFFFQAGPRVSHSQMSFDALIMSNLKAEKILERGKAGKRQSDGKQIAIRVLTEMRCY